MVPFQLCQRPVIPAVPGVHIPKLRQKIQHRHLPQAEGAQGQLRSFRGIIHILEEDLPQNLAVRQPLLEPLHLPQGHAGAPQIQPLQPPEGGQRLRLLQGLSGNIQLRPVEAVEFSVQNEEMRFKYQLSRPQQAQEQSQNQKYFPYPQIGLTHPNPLLFAI